MRGRGWQRRREWGGWRLLFLYVVIAPISPSLLLIAPSNHPGFGLAPLVCSAAGALSAVQPGGRLHWGLWYLTPSALGWRKLSSGVFMAVGLWMAYETLRIGLTQWQLMPMLLSLSVMFLSASTSYLLASLLFIPKIDAKLEQLQSIASGEKNLDELELILPKDASIPLKIMAEITQRCLDEQRHDVARVLATYLALREPDHPSYFVLRSFLQGTEKSS